MDRVEITPNSLKNNQMSGPPDPLVEVLKELAGLVRGLRQDLAVARNPQVLAPTVSRDDRARLETLLPAMGGVFGSELVNSAEICESDAAALRLVCAGLSARALGRLLRRAAGTPIAGYMVERVGLEAGAVLWRVVQVPEFSGNKKVSVPHASKRSLP
jgi:hypothetical protein